VEIESISAIDEGPINIQLVNKIVTMALRDRASTSANRATDGRIRIRYHRIDGAQRARWFDTTGPELVSRIKIMADHTVVEPSSPSAGMVN